MDILDLLANDNYIVINKSLAKEIGLENAIVFGALCGYQRGFENEEFYREQEKIIEDTGLTEYIIRKSLKELQKIGLIEISRKGMPAKYYYKINVDLTFTFLSSSPSKSATTSPSKSATTNKNNNKNNINKEILSNNELLSNTSLLEKNNKKSAVLLEKTKKLTNKEKLYYKLKSDILVKSPLYQKDIIRDLLVRWLNALLEINKLPSSNSLEDSLIELEKFNDDEIIEAINNSIKAGYSRFFPKKNLTVSADGINKQRNLTDYELQKMEESEKFIKEKYGNK